jgi:predicted transcriptional regulator
MAAKSVSVAQQVKDMFPDDFAYKDSKEGNKTAPTRWTIIHRKAKDTASGVLKTLHQNKINSVPIYDADAKKWLGFIDDHDLMTFAFKTFLADLSKEKEKKEDNSKTFQLFSDQDTKAMYDKLQKMGNFVESVISKSNATCAEVGSYNDRNAWKPVKWTDPVQTLIEIFGTTKVRRIPVIGDNNQVQQVITRSDVIEWMHENMNSFPELKITPMHKASTVKKDACTLPLTARAIDAFRLMVTAGVSAVGVTDGEGKIVGVIKFTDVKRADGNIGPRLHLPLHEYLQQQEKKKHLILSNLAAFSGAINMLNQHVARRIFIFDPNTNRPHGVFSQMDALIELHIHIKSQEPKEGTTKA